ncbi:MAG: methyltransferase domain-containing protein [Candidatus Glassbacteria bacterium]|nr:methyltransferase domain-containing protein [Candidatus Glassbacteria bacterium]
MSVPGPATFPLPNLLNRHAGPAARVLIIRSGPLELVQDILAVLSEWNSALEVVQYCHEGQELDILSNLIYSHPGYFRLKHADLDTLRSRNFDLVIVPYATDRRLHPEYHEVDLIAIETGAEAVIAVYWDRTALLLDENLLERKEREAVRPYLEQKKSAIEEIRRFTGEDPEVIEDKCHLAAARGDCLWREQSPASECEIEEFYSGTDFYIYALMKECDWRGARSWLAGLLADEIPPESSVLDYGAGCGALGIAMAERGYDFTHLDLPGPLLEFARSRYRARGLEVTVAAAEQPLPLSESYDAIICIHVLEHVPDPEDKLRHLAGHLAPDGSLCIAIPFEANPVGGEHPGLHLNRLTDQRYQTLIAELGFECVRQVDDLDILRRP